MHPIIPAQPTPLWDLAATRRIEAHAAAHLPAHTLMQRAGLAIARLARALAPHAQRFWVACGSGNNGGDGLEAALHLHRLGVPVHVTWPGLGTRLPADAQAAWQRAQAAGVVLHHSIPPHLQAHDLCIDALLGIGLTPESTARPPNAYLHACLTALHHSPAPVLCVDLPSGLQSDTGQYASGLAPPTSARSARYTLGLLTLKPGLFTGAGRDAAGQVWWDDLGIAPHHEPPCAWLGGTPLHTPRAHASHKGLWGDVAIVGGQGLEPHGLGMTGAALLAACAALHAGAGRVLATLLDGGLQTSDALQPEIMLRHFAALDLERLTGVCGCGGGTAITPLLPSLLKTVPRLVLDADALNAIAADPALQQALQARAGRAQSTVLTPHPLEAARLLGSSTQAVQSQRLQAAQQLAEQLACTVVLKGSGSIIAAPGHTPVINPTGNARLASAGTGDVLAGLLGARLAMLQGDGFEAACSACWEHGHLADTWPPAQALTASRLARRLHAA